MSTTSISRSTHPLLAKYLVQLATHPLRTKALTTGKGTLSIAHTSRFIKVDFLSPFLTPHSKFSTSPAALCFLQEVLGSHLAGVSVKKPSYNASPVAQLLARSHINLKALKMALYGFLVSAPISHYLIGQLQKSFAGKTGPAAKIGQILANSLLVSPIQTAGTCVRAFLLSSLFLVCALLMGIFFSR